MSVSGPAQCGGLAGPVFRAVGKANLNRIGIAVLAAVAATKFLAADVAGAMMDTCGFPIAPADHVAVVGSPFAPALTRGDASGQTLHVTIVDSVGMRQDDNVFASYCAYRVKYAQPPAAPDVHLAEWQDTGPSETEPSGRRGRTSVIWALPAAGSSRDETHPVARDNWESPIAHRLTGATARTCHPRIASCIETARGNA